MKYHRFSLQVVSLLFLFSVIFFSTENNLAQSGREVEPTAEKAITIQNPDEKKPSEIDYTKLESYDYIEPTNVEPFLKTLNKLGAKGYQIRNITQIPFTAAEKPTGFSSVNLAGIVKLGEGKYEYKFIDIEKTRDDLAATLNDESKEGFNPREILTFLSSQVYDSGKTDGISVSMDAMLSGPTLNNFILLERETGKKIVPREFIVLKAGAGIIKNSSEKMQLRLDEAAKQNYIPIGVFLRLGFAGPQPKGEPYKLLDNYYGSILEKTSEKQNLQIRFLHTSRFGTFGAFKKRINKLAREGFKVSDIQLMEGLMYKDLDETNPPVNYVWIKAGAKKLDDEMSKLSKTGAKLRDKTLVKNFWIPVLNENNLMFEQPTAQTQTRYEYKSLKMVSDAPQTVLIGNTIVAPDAPIKKFREIINQGYTFASLLCVDDTVTAVFERQISKTINE